MKTFLKAPCQACFKIIEIDPHVLLVQGNTEKPYHFLCFIDKFAFVRFETTDGFVKFKKRKVKK